MTNLPDLSHLTLSEAVELIMSQCGCDEESARLWLLRALAQGDLQARGYTSRSHDRRGDEIESAGWVSGRADWHGNTIAYGSANVRKQYVDIEIGRRRLDRLLRRHEDAIAPPRPLVPDLGIVPAGCIGIMDMLSAIVERRHGEEWTRPIEVYKDVNTGELLIAGGPPRDRRERFAEIWEDACESLISGFRRQQIEVFVDAGEGRHYRVSQFYWNAGAGYRTVRSGRLELDTAENGAPTERLLDRKSCLALRAQFESWLSMLTPLNGAEPPAPLSPGSTSAAELKPWWMEKLRPWRGKFENLDRPYLEDALRRWERHERTTFRDCITATVPRHVVNGHRIQRRCYDMWKDVADEIEARRSTKPSPLEDA